jgi:hypothetical protein
MILITYQKRIMARVCLNLDINASFNSFMGAVLYIYNIAFPLKTVYRSNVEKNKWITQGICNSCNRMRVLNGLRKQYNLSREMQEYIKRYQIIYKRVIDMLKEEKMISLF